MTLVSIQRAIPWPVEVFKGPLKTLINPLRDLVQNYNPGLHVHYSISVS